MWGYYRTLWQTRKESKYIGLMSVRPRRSGIISTKGFQVSDEDDESAVEVLGVSVELSLISFWSPPSDFPWLSGPQELLLLLLLPPLLEPPDVAGLVLRHWFSPCGNKSFTKWENFSPFGRSSSEASPFWDLLSDDGWQSFTEMRKTNTNLMHWIAISFQGRRMEWSSDKINKFW